MVGMIKKEDVEKVRAAADLYDIVSATVTLKPSGTGTFVGLCPFHDEKTGSFNVRPSLGVWHCFGCGLGGDVFKYVEQSENIDFREAVELLADKYHIELHYENSGNGPARENTGSKRTRLLEACEEAQRFFVSQILTKEALPARKLLGGRNFSQADCERFGCGYAPQGWDNLVRHLASKGFTQKEILDAGLARQGQRGIYDYFRGRVTWPIRDSTGRTLGFGARKLYEDDQIAAKYINTPDTQLYRKTQVLYGIDLAKSAIVKKRQVVIVEGYTDVMAMHLAGIDTAIATCGTAFGAEHAKIVRRLIADDSLGAVQLVGPLKVKDQPLSSRIVFTFDGDAAGQKAALHAFGLDSAFLSQTFVAVADDNLDPCDLRIERGNESTGDRVRDGGEDDRDVGALGLGLHRDGDRSGYADHQVDAVGFEVRDDLGKDVCVGVAVVVFDLERHAVLFADGGELRLDVFDDLVEGCVVDVVAKADLEDLTGISGVFCGIGGFSGFCGISRFSGVRGGVGGGVCGVCGLGSAGGKREQHHGREDERDDLFHNTKSFL